MGGDPAIDVSDTLAGAAFIFGSHVLGAFDEFAAAGVAAQVPDLHLGAVVDCLGIWHCGELVHGCGIQVNDH